jgi:hypothetical protein
VAALILALGLFATAWLAHLAWWRLSLPRHHTLALLIIFSATPFVAAAASLVLGGGPSLVPAPAIPCVLALYAAATGCYLIAYAGVEQTSPSLVIIRALQAAGSSGCTHDDLGRLVTEDVFLKPRLEALRSDGLLAASGAGGYVLTQRGRRAARLALAFTRVFNIRSHG